MTKKCVIITTINNITETIKKHIDFGKYDIIIVGDKKTPDCYYNINCIYLDLKYQKQNFPILYDLIPLNHYSRKNFGYLYAIKNNYDIIYETDDDNIPYDNFDNILNFNNIPIIEECNAEWINIFKFFTNNGHIWPRGYPLSLIQNNKNPTFNIHNNNSISPDIICGLVENDPDVDSIYRLTANENINWEKEKKIIISNKNVTVFNTQNTFWVNKQLFILLLIPCSTSFRYCDILRSIIADKIIKQNNNYIGYTSPNVKQIRNEHDLINDFKQEFEMFTNNEIILNIIKEISTIEDNSKLLLTIYEKLYENKIVSEIDIKICKLWITYFK